VGVPSFVFIITSFLFFFTISFLIYAFTHRIRKNFFSKCHHEWHH
jgi:hypothetical protein